MLEIFVILAIYTVAILLFVPLERIGKWQSAVRKQVKKITDKVN